MRASLLLFSLLTVVSLPPLAHAQNAGWGVQPPPASWGVPQNQAAPVYRDGPPPAQRAQSLEDAVTCSAALQLATMAAPNWARERGVTDSTNAWLQKVFELAQPRGIQGDQVPALVEAEMQRQVDDAARDPANLSRRAFDCASRQP